MGGGPKGRRPRFKRTDSVNVRSPRPPASVSEVRGSSRHGDGLSWRRPSRKAQGRALSSSAAGLA